MTEATWSAASAQAPEATTPPAVPRPLYLVVPSLIFLVFASVMMLRGVDPFVTFFYIFAWYPTIVLLDCAIAARTGSYYLLDRPRFAASLLGWSAVLWFFFEAINFRVQNWYYISLPPSLPVRWLGTTASFATVLPAIFLAEKWLASRRAFAVDRWPTFKLKDAVLAGVFITGIIFIALSLIWPRLFFPLIWGALTLLLEPLNYRKDPGRSLLGDLAAGRPARLLRLLVAGLLIGFVWEMYNIEARSKWVYTVPGFENFKLFEMPLLGFLGFPVFALDCFVAYQSLVLARVAVPEEPEAHNPGLRPSRTLAAAIAAAAFSLAALVGMDRWNTDSLSPRLHGFWIAGPAAREQLAETPFADLFRLASADANVVAEAAAVPLAQAETWVAAARLVTLHGLGTENAKSLWDAGIRSIEGLAAADPERIGRSLREHSQRPRSATPAKVRVWVRAAQRASATPGP